MYFLLEENWRPLELQMYKLSKNISLSLTTPSIKSIKRKFKVAIRKIILKICKENI